MANKPTVILVHGFWGGAAHWSKVIVGLAQKGYQSVYAVERESNPHLLGGSQLERLS